MSILNLILRPPKYVQGNTIKFMIISRNYKTAHFDFRFLRKYVPFRKNIYTKRNGGSRLKI